MIKKQHILSLHSNQSFILMLKGQFFIGILQTPCDALKFAILFVAVFPTLQAIILPLAATCTWISDSRAYIGGISCGTQRKVLT